MVGTGGSSQKPATTTKDVLIDFLAGGTGLYLNFICLIKLLNFFFSSCMYSIAFFISNVYFDDFRELFQKPL